MSNLIVQAIAFVLGNVPFIGLLIALLLGFFRCAGAQACDSKGVKNTILAYIFLLPIGIGGIWGFIVHAFFPQVADKVIGWSPSPFEFEVAVANLGMGVTGIIAFKENRGFRLATAVFITCFGWGAAIGHIHQMVIAHNFTPGNAGIIFWTDILIPLITWSLLINTHPKSNKS